MTDPDSRHQPGFVSRLSFLHKGLILITVPLVFELIFVTVLGYLFYQSNAQLNNAIEAKQVSDETSDMMFNYVDMIGAETAYALFKSPKMLQRCQELMSTIPGQMKDIESRLASDTESATEFRSIEQNVNQTLGWAQQMHDRVSQPDTTLSPVELINLQKVFLRTRKSMDGLVKHRREFERSAPMLEARHQSQLLYALVDGISINILIVIALALYLYKVTAKRLTALMTNIKRFAEQKPLNRPLAGSDEIAQLDGVFCEMAQSLAAAAENDRKITELKQQFVAIVSHDLRTPLSSIQGSLSLIAGGDYGRLSGRGPELLSVALSEIDRLSKLVQDLLDLAKIEAGRLQLQYGMTSADAIVTRAMSSVAEFAASRNVTIESDRSNVDLEVDPDRIVQVLINLLTNAIKFSNADGAVQVRVSTSTSDADSNWIKIEVIDHGRGVPADRLATIFEPFRQVEVDDARERGGTGLGLSICKNIVEQHGGTIGVESDFGKGSNFWLTLPSKPVHQDDAS